MKPLTQIAAFASLALLALAPATPAAEAATLEAVRAALPKLEAYADKLVEDDEVPGLAVAVVFGDEVVYAKGFGIRVEGGPKLIDADTVFQIAYALVDPGHFRCPTGLWRAFHTSKFPMRISWSARSGQPSKSPVCAS